MVDERMVSAGATRSGTISLRRILGGDFKQPGLRLTFGVAVPGRWTSTTIIAFSNKG